MNEVLIKIQITLFILLLISACNENGQEVTTGSLLEEMTDLERLTSAGNINYRTLQFSSYDRRSISPFEQGWFANEDGFGGEVIPGFEKVLKMPDSAGIGEYLICDIRDAGAIQRLWTAVLTGKIRLFIDDMKTPVYEGRASDLFWKPLETITQISDSASYSRTFRQFDATYLPIPFAKGCRIEWIGNIQDPHFYHVGIRIYEKGTKVETFKISAYTKYIQKLKETNLRLMYPDSIKISDNRIMVNSLTEIASGETKDVFIMKEGGAIYLLRIKMSAQNLEKTLRQCILNIFFDNTKNPQVHAPVGDFFGAAPGLNPYHSLTFSVSSDTIMECRFIMPFRNSVRIEIENRSNENIRLDAVVKTGSYRWQEGKSMHFRTQWKMKHNLIAYNTDSMIYDMNYLDVAGKGRLVGVATYIYNPSPVPTSWGNWWGEGDEKVFVDGEAFPSFFGTGSEDYYNYSWSSPLIFSYPYCGQPRNDGPGNRGYVSNFRWHIADDIPFRKSLDFNMELRHHGVVPDFSYGSIVYFYTLPENVPGFKKIEEKDIPDPEYLIWSPLAYLGCEGFIFIQAEELAVKNENLAIENGKYWSEDNILTWFPENPGERLVFKIRSKDTKLKTRIGFTLAHSSDGGTISFILNGKTLKFDNNESINLKSINRVVLDNHFSEPVDLKRGDNELVVTMPAADGLTAARFDFAWLLTK